MTPDSTSVGRDTPSSSSGSYAATFLPIRGKDTQTANAPASFPRRGARDTTTTSDSISFEGTPASSPKSTAVTALSISPPRVAHELEMALDSTKLRRSPTSSPKSSAVTAPQQGIQAPSAPSSSPSRVAQESATTSDSANRGGTPFASSASSLVTVPCKSASSNYEKLPYRLQPPRTLPPWVKSQGQLEEIATVENSLKLQAPARVVAPQPNSTPPEPQQRVSRDGYIDEGDPSLGPPQPVPSRISHFLRHGRAPRRGRIWDHLRSSEPVIVPAYNMSPLPSRARWRDFIKSSAYGRPKGERSQIVTRDYLNQLSPNFSRMPSMRVDPNPSRLPRSGPTLTPCKRLWDMALRHWLSPLLFRLSVMITSIIALGIAARIYKEEGKAEHRGAESAQSIFAVAVDVVAIPFTTFMIWDELIGKPLGLRSAANKMSLILLDLFFIVFKAASTALAFETLVYQKIAFKSIRQLANAMAAFMLIGLLSWTLNLSVNIFRVIEKLEGRKKAIMRSKVDCV